MAPYGSIGDFQDIPAGLSVSVDRRYSVLATDGRQPHLEKPPAMRDHTSDHLIEGVRLAMKASPVIEICAEEQIESCRYTE